MRSWRPPAYPTTGSPRDGRVTRWPGPLPAFSAYLATVAQIRPGGLDALSV